MTGALLAMTVRDAPASARAYHGYGMTDAEGFAALGAAEVVLHTHDIAAGIGVPFEPDAATSSWLLGRLHCDLPEDDAPWQLLLWVTGRGDPAGARTGAPVAVESRAGHAGRCFVVGCSGDDRDP